MATAAPTVEVVRGPQRAATLFEHPLRIRVMAALDAPDSATGLARRLGQPRQLVNYHLRELERAGFVELAEERRKGNLTERVMRATATHWVISPEALGALAPEPAALQDRFSWAYLCASAARVIRDLGILRGRADAVQKKLATFTLETEICFASAADRDAFTTELATTVTALAVKYHQESASGGRWFRFVLGAYPKITKTEAEAAAEARKAGEPS